MICVSAKPCVGAERHHAGRCPSATLLGGAAAPASSSRGALRADLRSRQRACCCASSSFLQRLDLLAAPAPSAAARSAGPCRSSAAAGPAPRACVPYHQRQAAQVTPDATSSATGSATDEHAGLEDVHGRRSSELTSLNLSTSAGQTPSRAIQHMVLAAAARDLQRAEPVAELGAALQRPAALEPVEQRGAKGVAAAGRVDHLVGRDARHMRALAVAARPRSPRRRA